MAETTLEATPPREQSRRQVGTLEAFYVWVRVAAYSFGGPAGQISVMHNILVEEKRWVSERRFLHALNYTMLLPGPEAQQLATYIGWLLHGTRGGLLAGSLFILPGFLTILALSILYAGYREFTLVEALFFGLKPAVMAIVLDAVFRIGKRALRTPAMVAIAIVSFIAIFFFDVAFPLIVAAAALAGYVIGRLAPGLMTREAEAEAEDDEAIQTQPNERPSLRRSVKIALIFGGLWLVPIALFLLFLGPDHIFSEESTFFSQAAVVTFGGAYAVLAYIAQEAVATQGWLLPGEMLDGLAMAETTPGPLIQVVQFVGFMGAYRDPGSLSPLTAGLIGSLIVTWVTFVPCFLWIFLGAPYIEYLRDNRALSNALSGITSAVVGVVLNLALWFSLNALFAQVEPVQRGPLQILVPVWGTLDLAALLIAIGAFVAMFQLKWGMLRTLAVSASVGFVYYLLFRGQI